MELHGNIVVTPLDNPCQFDPDWRNEIAVFLIDYPNEKIDPEYLIYKSDPWIKKQVSYLSFVKRGSKLRDWMYNFRLASIWSRGERAADVKFRLEPLLLTPVSMDAISLDIGGGTVDTEAFEIYEKLYFNIRLDDGRLHPSCQLRQYFALPEGEAADDPPLDQVWKMVGALMGYDTLVSAWLWNDAHGRTHTSQEYMLDEMWRVAQSRIFMSMFQNRVGHESMAKLLGSFTAQKKMISDLKKDGSSGIDTAQTLMALLYKSSPEIITTAKTVDTLPMMNSAIKARLRAQQSIGKHDVSDAGKEIGEDALNNTLLQAFKEK